MKAAARRVLGRAPTCPFTRPPQRAGAKMMPAQIAEAQRMASEWKPK
jgi:hypothetical protein